MGCGDSKEKKEDEKKEKEPTTEEGKPVQGAAPARTARPIDLNSPPEKEAAAEPKKPEEVEVTDVFPDLTKDHLKEAFDNFDADGNGHMDRTELRNFFQFCGQDPEEGHIEQYFVMCDTNQDGKISFDEMQPIFQSMAQHLVKAVNQLRDAYAVMDKDGDGCVDKEEARKAIEALDEVPGLSKERILETCFTKRGVLSYKEFGRVLFGAGMYARQGLDAMMHACEARKLKDLNVPEDANDDSGVSDEDFAKTQEMLEATTAKYGLKLVWDEEVAEEGAAPGTGGPPCSKKMMMMFTPLFCKELELYPPSLFLKGEAEGGYDWIETVYICGGLSLGGQPVGGFALPHRSALAVNAACIFEGVKDDDDIKYRIGPFKTVLHHELFHLIDFCLAFHRGADNPAADDESWQGLNEFNFTYDDQRDGKYANLSSYSLQNDTGPNGFMNSYQVASMLEDKGCVYGSLFADPTYVKEKCESDDIVKKKVSLMKSNLEGYCPEMNADFWNQEALRADE